MPKLKATLIALAVSLNLAIAPSAAPKVDAQALAQAAFKPPTVPFQARIMMTEWGEGGSWADEARLYFSPPSMYRIEFLEFDGTVKKVVLTDGKTTKVTTPDNETVSAGNDVVQLPPLLNQQQMSDLLSANYTFELVGADTFIGRPVWVLNLIPRNSGKPRHELKIDQQTLVVLEQRSYVVKNKIGSLTRFANFTPNKSLSSDAFLMNGSDGVLKEKSDIELSGTPPETPAAYQSLPAGFSLNGVRTFEVQGTPANHFSYTDGALPLSVFETKLPVRFPSNTEAIASNPAALLTGGFSSADQVVYGRHGENYFTIIGEASPDLLNTIADHFNY